MAWFVKFLGLPFVIRLLEQKSRVWKREGHVYDMDEVQTRVLMRSSETVVFYDGTNVSPGSITLIPILARTYAYEGPNIYPHAFT